MAQTDLGVVVAVPKGAWSSTTRYDKLNIVRHNGGAYMAIAESQGIEPNVSSSWQSYWMLLNQDTINTTEQWTFTLEDGSTVTKNVVVAQ